MSAPRPDRLPAGRFLVLLLIALLAGSLFVDTAAARVKKVAFVDDDWDPVERGPYDADPHYETYFFEALDLLGYDYDVFEIQPDGGEPQVPSIDELAAYPYVIWNCASAESIALDYPERRLLREYRRLGGKLMLLGQGILNALGLPPYEPDVQDFLRFELGIDSFGVDATVLGMQPTDTLGYGEDIGFVTIDTSNLPDPDPTKGDIVYPTADATSHLIGTLASGATAPIATNRYLPAPLHFQPVLMEAITDPALRADYIGSYSEWLGFEGDDLMDFMDGLEDLELVASCPPHVLEWDPGQHAIRFAAHGAATCDAVLAMGLAPEGEDCSDWSVRFTHRINVVGAGSEMDLLELAGGPDLLRVLAVPSNDEDGSYDIRLKFFRDGHLLFDHRFENLAPQVTRRIRVSQVVEPPLVGLELFDTLGNFIDGVSFAGYVIGIEELRLRARGLNQPSALPIIGWVDDIAIGGCLVSRLTTAVPETPLLLGTLRVQPNPFNPSTRISGELVAAGRVELGVFDAQGRRQRVLASGELPAGPFSLEWDGRDDAGRRLPGGVYFVRLSDGRGARAVKLVMLK